MKAASKFFLAILISSSAFGAGANEEIMKVMKSMCENVDTMPMSQNVDETFSMMMIPHHQSAVDMAEAYLKEGADPEIRAKAEQIIAAQKEEIEFFKTWLAKHKNDDTSTSL